MKKSLFVRNSRFPLEKKEIDFYTQTRENYYKLKNTEKELANSLGSENIPNLSGDYLSQVIKTDEAQLFRNSYRKAGERENQFNQYREYIKNMKADIIVELFKTCPRFLEGVINSFGIPIEYFAATDKNIRDIAIKGLTRNVSSYLNGPGYGVDKFESLFKAIANLNNEDILITMGELTHSGIVENISINIRFAPKGIDDIYNFPEDTVYANSRLIDYNVGDGRILGINLKYDFHSHKRICTRQLYDIKSIQERIKVYLNEMSKYYNNGHPENSENGYKAEFTTYRLKNN